MLKTRYRKLSGLHAGHVYEVTAPANEMQSPMQWSLQCETIPDQKLTVGEDELSDRTRWEPLG
ncbi:hypothetical protein [Aestuariivirga sp.]|uniref:hypothetical protein n=1 Tax=Aestuariivirga sp. TaxID=2650926 RepID=UPI003919EEA4